MEPSELLRADTVEQFVEHVLITFKFGGSWVNIKNQSRQKYKGGKQKTIKLEKSKINFLMLKNEFEKICQWARGHNFDLYYHICGSSPKEYNLIISDFEVNEMINQSTQSCRFEGMFTGVLLNFMNYYGWLVQWMWQIWEDFITIVGVSVLPQHSIDYWLWADLIAPQSERLLKNGIRIFLQGCTNF